MMKIRKSNADDVPGLFDLWLRSVRATKVQKPFMSLGTLMPKTSTVLLDLTWWELRKPDLALDCCFACH
jgi:hypothetical protein